MTNSIQNRINTFHKENGNRKIKIVNNKCAKGKKTCTHMKDGKCIRGWCGI